MEDKLNLSEKETKEKESALQEDLGKKEIELGNLREVVKLKEGLENQLSSLKKELQLKEEALEVRKKEILRKSAPSKGLEPVTLRLKA